MFYVYLLRSKRITDELYVGSTVDLRRRISEHNAGKVFSTKRYMPWELIYYEAYFIEGLARMREKRLKHHGNAIKQLLRRAGVYPAPFSKKTGAGFTLIELLVSMAIIALIAVLGYGAYIRAQKRALDSRRQGDMKAFANAMEQAYVVSGDYPDDAVVAGQEFPGGNLPTDPINSVPYGYEFAYTDPEVPSADGYCGCALLAIFDGNADDAACDYVGPHPDKTPRPYFCVSNIQ